MVPLAPLATPSLTGIPWWKDENETVHNETLLMKDNQLIMSNVLNFKAQEDWLKWHGFNEWEIKAANPWGKWLADTCQETLFNKKRSKFGIIGDVKNS